MLSFSTAFVQALLALGAGVGWDEIFQDEVNEHQAGNPRLADGKHDEDSELLIYFFKSRIVAFISHSWDGVAVIE